MEQKTELKTYRIDKQCEKCNKGLMIKTGNAIQKWDTDYEHKCDSCGEFIWYSNKYYPAIVYEYAARPRIPHKHPALLR